MKVYILTSKDFPNFFYDDSALAEAFEKRGIDWEVLIWDEAKIPDNSTVLIRTIWDYTKKPELFKEMLIDFKKRDIKVINPIETLKWNMDKTYLLELLEAGASVVPTYISKLFREDCISLSQISYPLVVKPLVGASGRDTFLLENRDHQIDLSNLFKREVIIQPFMKSVLEEGEISFVFFGKEFSHAVVKSSNGGEFRIQEEHGGSVKEYIPSNEELDYINEILSHVTYEWEYARVDVVRDQGKFYLMELELIEPELFFRFSDNGEQLLVDSIFNKID